MRAAISAALMMIALGGALIWSGNDSQPRRPAAPSPATLRTPERIVSLSAAATDSLVALGVRPVLVESAWKSAGPAPYLAEQMPGLAVVRRGGAISVEGVLDAEPDLIFAGGQDGRLYGQLSQIAPTVSLPTGMSNDRETILLDIGTAIGMSEQAHRRLIEYRRRVERAKQKLTACVAGQPVVFLRFRQRTCVIYARTAMFGPLLFDKLGLTPDPAMPMTMSPGGWDVLSVERLSTLRAEHIFLVVDTDSEAYWQRVSDTPLWQNIPAVKRGSVHRVAAGTWIGGEGVLANEAIIRDVLAVLVPQRSSDAPG